MKTSAAFAVLLRLALSTAAARERPVDATDHRRYASGEVMDRILEAKTAAWDHYRSRGYFAPGRHPSANRFVPCRNGYVTVIDHGTAINYACRNLDVTGHLTHDDLGSADPTQRIGEWLSLERRRSD